MRVNATFVPQCGGYTHPDVADCAALPQFEMDWRMTWKITPLDLGSVELDGSRTVMTMKPGELVRAPVYAFLLSSRDMAVLVDTGFRHPDILQRLGMRAFETPEQRLEIQLAAHGLKPGDIPVLLQTHLHIDHAGKTDMFPMTTTVVINRRELEYSVSGLSGASYPPEDIIHLIHRLHTPNALRLLDLEETNGEEVLPGLRCVAAGGHTEGSMVIYVETEAGHACLCGDILYNIREQLTAATTLNADPVTSGNFVNTRRSEKSAIKRVLNSGIRFLYPSHDGPATVERGKVVRMGVDVSG
jgi:glyoxylase-like metal-dependent hydrolase (beta-lactamase superfamily II)